MSGKAFHRRYCATGDGVAFENLHRPAGIGQIAGGGQGIVAGAHHHSIDHPFMLLARPAATGDPERRRAADRPRK